MDSFNNNTTTTTTTTTSAWAAQVAIEAAAAASHFALQQHQQEQSPTATATLDELLMPLPFLPGVESGLSPLTPPASEASSCSTSSMLEALDVDVRLRKKIERRRAQNRVSASVCRRREKQQLSQMREQLPSILKENARLEQSLRAVQNRHQTLVEQVALLRLLMVSKKHGISLPTSLASLSSS